MNKIITFFNLIVACLFSWIVGLIALPIVLFMLVFMPYYYTVGMSAFWHAVRDEAKKGL